MPVDMQSDGLRRCPWAQNDPLLRTYHDLEWGVPQHDSRSLWEMLVLEGFQAGLSWLTILRRREAFRLAFAGFDPQKVARFGQRDTKRLLSDAGIIRSRAKIDAAITSARLYLAMQEGGEDFARYAWGWVDDKPVVNTGRATPAQTPLSEALSKDLRQRGFKFVGPVIVYAWMQSVGLVDDHSSDCFRRAGRHS